MTVPSQSENRARAPSRSRVRYPGRNLLVRPQTIAGTRIPDQIVGPGRCKGPETEASPEFSSTCFPVQVTIPQLNGCRTFPPKQPESRKTEPGQVRSPTEVWQYVICKRRCARTSSALVRHMLRRFACFRRRLAAHHPGRIEDDERAQRSGCPRDFPLPSGGS